MGDGALRICNGQAELEQILLYFVLVCKSTCEAHFGALGLKAPINASLSLTFYAKIPPFYIWVHLHN